MFFKLSEATAARRRVPVHCCDATDGITAETGEASGQPQVSKNGGAWANTSATLVAIGNGAYYVELTATELNTIGLVQVRYKSANTAEYQIDGFVFSYDPYDSVRLGLTALPNAAAEAAGGLYTRGTGAGQVNQNANGQVDARAVGLSAGAIVAASFGAGAIDAAAIATDAIGAAEFAQGAADKVWATTTRAVTDKAGFALSAAGVQAIWDALTSALSTASSIGKLLVDNVNATISSRLATSGYTAPLSAAATANAVWDEPIAGHVTAGTTGNKLNAAGSAGDPWTTALPGAYGAGTAGKIVGDNVNATISSRLATAGYTVPPTVGAISTQVWSETTRTLTGFGTLVADVAAAVWAAGTRTLTAGAAPSVADIWTYVTRTLTAGGAAPTAAEVADAVWDEPLASHLGGGSTGNTLNAITGAGGAGGLTLTYTVTNSVTGLPLDDVQVWVTTDLAGTNVVASGRTDAFGVVTFALDAGTYYLFRAKSGFNFPNPDTEVVA